MKKLIVLTAVMLCCMMMCGITAHAAGEVSVDIPVTITSGGTAVIIPEVNCPFPSFSELELSDGETGSFHIDFSEEGYYTYRLMIIPDTRNITFDSTVYTVKADVTKQDGQLYCVLVIYNTTTGLKPDKAHFENSLLPPTEPPTVSVTQAPAQTPADTRVSSNQPKTGDDTRMELYLLLAILAAAGLFTLSVLYTIDTNRLCKQNRSQLF